MDSRNKNEQIMIWFVPIDENKKEEDREDREFNDLIFYEIATTIGYFKDVDYGVMFTFEWFQFEEFQYFEELLKLIVIKDIHFLKCKISLASNFGWAKIWRENSSVYFTECSIYDEGGNITIKALLYLIEGLLSMNFKLSRIFFNQWEFFKIYKLLDVLVHEGKQNYIKIYLEEWLSKLVDHIEWSTKFQNFKNVYKHSQDKTLF